MDGYWESMQTPGARRWRGAPRVPRAPRTRCARQPRGPCVPGAPGAPNVLRVPHASSAPRARRAQSEPGAPVRVTAHIGKPLDPRHPGQKPMQNGGGVAIMVYGVHTRNHVALVFDRDCGPARTRQYEGTPTIPDKKQYKVIAGRPRMAQYFAAKWTLYCFLTGMVGGGGALFRVGRRPGGGGGVY